VVQPYSASAQHRQLCAGAQTVPLSSVTPAERSPGPGARACGLLLLLRARGLAGLRQALDAAAAAGHAQVLQVVVAVVRQAQADNLAPAVLR